MEIRYFWLAFLAALIIFSYYVFFFEPGQIVVKKTKLDIGLNESIRIVFISDIHVETISDEYLGQVVVAANSQNADYIFLGGDYSDGGSQISRLAPLGDLQAKKGQFAVLGNHDYLYDETSCSKSQEETGNEISSLLESMGFSVLRNDVVELEGFSLAGIDDDWACRDDYFSAIEGVDLSGPGILLTHNQEAVPYDEYQNWNLILAGHTHCGQVRVPPIGSIPKALGMFGIYDMGHFEPYPDSHVYISCGIGGGPRMLNPPEITVIELS